MNDIIHIPVKRHFPRIRVSRARKEAPGLGVFGDFADGCKIRLYLNVWKSLFMLMLYWGSWDIDKLVEELELAIVDGMTQGKERQ